MASSMRETGLGEIKKGVGYSSGLIIPNTKVNTTRDKNMAKAYFTGLMGILTKVNMFLESKKAVVFSTGPMDVNTTGNITRDKSREKALLLGLMAANMLVNFLRGCNTALASTLYVTVSRIMAIIRKAGNQAKVLKLTQTKTNT